MTMLALIVFIPFVLVLVLWRKRLRDPRELFLIAAITWGGLVILLTELLSLFNRVSSFWLFAAWIAGAVAVAAAAPLIPSMPPIESESSQKLNRWFRLILAGVFVIVAVSGLVAWIGPPNNWDSMTYHLTRVVHWIQNGNVAFYPTCMPSQLELPPGAEYIILSLQVLSGSDRLANLVQWFAFVGCIVGVTHIARLLGAGPRGQVLAAGFAATLPSACLQAVTTQGDLAAAFWLVCFIGLGLRIRKAADSSRPQWFSFVLCGLSAGLALVTRATSYIWVAPFAVALVGVAWAKYRWRAVTPLLLAGSFVFVLNLPVYVRNFRFTHTMLGNPGNRLPFVNAHFGVGPAVSNMVRNIALEMVGPWKLGRMLDEGAARAVHKALGLDPSDPASTWPGMQFHVSGQMWNGEDTAGNPLHMALVFAALATLLLIHRRGDTHLLLYAASVASGFVAFCAYVRWMPFHARLLLPLSIVCGPFVGAAMERRWNHRVAAGIVLFFAPAAMVLIASNHLHPFFGRHGIFTTDRTSRYFLSQPDLEAPYRAMARRAADLHCRQVGLILHGNNLEYPLDVLLKRVDPAIRIETIPQKGLLDPGTANTGWRDDIRPAMIVKITDDSATIVSSDCSQPKHEVHGEDKTEKGPR